MPTRNGKHTRTRSRRQSEKKQKTLGKEAKQKQTDKRNLLVHHTSILLVLLKSPLRVAFFCCGCRWSCCWKRAYSIVSHSPTLQHSFKHSTPNYLLKLPLYRHWLLAFFAWNTNVENHLEIECDVWKLCESMRLWLFLCYITVYLFFARLFSIIWSVLPRENNGNVPFQLKVEVEGHFFLSSIHLSVCHLVAYPWVRFSQ